MNLRSSVLRYKEPLMQNSDLATVGVVARLAKWCIAHRRLTIVTWLVVLVGALGASGAIGSHYSNSNSLHGTESQRTADLLASRFPSQAGDNDQIVLHVARGSVTASSVQSRIAPMLARVARLPHVTGVVSPFGPGGAQQVSRDGTIAFATVLFDQRANSLPKPAIQAVINTAQAARAPGLQVELGGQAIEQAQGVSVGPATGVGLAAAIVVLLITFGSLVATGLPILTALLGLGTAFGLIAIGSHVVSMPDISTELAAMIGLGVGIDYALFIITRFRESVRGGRDVQSAVVEAMDTSGRAVLFAGVTVIVALLGMLVLGVAFLAGLAVSSTLAVLLTMVATLTLLPVLLARFGERVAGTRRSRARTAAAPDIAQPVGDPQPVVAATGRPALWERWALLIRRRPWPAAVAGLAIMLLVAVPALSMRLGLSDAGNDPTSTTTRQAYDLLAQGFGKGFNGPLVVAATLPRAGDQPALTRVQTALRTDSAVAGVSPARLSSDGQTAVYEVFPRSAPQDQATTDLVNRLRGTVLPPVAKATGATLLVGGPTASGIDFTHVLGGKLPVFIAIVVLLAAVLLLVVFRSLVIPLQAALMNLLSIGAALGVTVAVFQNGWLGGLVGVTQGPIEPWLPVMLFAIVFGLSMDYEVFLVSRIHEEWQRRRNASEAVVTGIGSTGRVITAAATIMIAVFLSFVLGDDRAIKLFGLSLASAVFLDAFVIRSLLLPAVLEILGRRTWAIPGWLDRRLPRLAIERPELKPTPQPARERSLEPAMDSA
jgi:putative drug exporter of the RND superfamily